MRSRSALILVILFLLTIVMPAKKMSFTVGAGYNQFNSDVKDIYSGTNISYSVDFAYRFAGKSEVFLHSDLLSAKGKLSHTGEDTTLKITPIEAGVRFAFGNRLAPYLGIGAGSYNYKESNPIGEASGSGFGFFGEGGIFFNAGSLFLDIKIKYVLAKIDNVDIGGLKGLLGFGIRF